jgi:hypothetical protein
MSKKNGRFQPSTPQEIAERRAAERAEERERQKNPENWSIANDIDTLPSAADIDLIRGERRRIIHAQRHDPFDVLYRAKALSVGQHQAVQRMWTFWCQSMGIRTDDARPAMELVQSSGSRDLVPQRQIDARRRYLLVMSYVGAADARLFEYLLTPAVMCGSVTIWRAIVEEIALEKEKHAQAAVIRRACENLRLALDFYDRFHREGDLEEAMRRRNLEDHSREVEA